MKMGDEKGFLANIINWFQRLSKTVQLGLLSSAALVVCGVIAVSVAFHLNSVPVDTGVPSSTVISDTESVSESSEAESSTESSEPEESEEVSEPASQDQSSKETASHTSSKATSSKATSSKPVVSKADTSSKTVTSAATTSSEPAASTPDEQEPASSEAAASEPVSSAAQSGGSGEISKEFKEIVAKNSDVKGHLTLSGTKLNYWVALGSDNSFYLNHGLDKEKYAWGTPCMDFRTTLTKDARSTNIVIYGHSNDKTGEHFSAIKNYKSIDFYKAHPTIEFSTLYGGESTYKVIGMFPENVNVSGVSFGYHNFINAQNEQEFNEFVAQVKGRSLLTMPVDCVYGDQLITLSTCVSTTTRNSRYVMVARRLRAGESASVDTSKVTENTNRIQPSGPLN